jgi:hypothetical protein
MKNDEQKKAPVCETEAGATSNDLNATATSPEAQPENAGSAAQSRIGYVQLLRTAETEEFMRRDPKGFILAAFIALRARRTGKLNFDGLRIGEAMLGDFATYGMTEGEYREAKKRLEKIEFATFRTTGKGTIAKLINTDVFDPNLENNNGQNNAPHNGGTTEKQRRRNGGATTNKREKAQNEKPFSLLEKSQKAVSGRAPGVDGFATPAPPSQPTDDLPPPVTMPAVTGYDNEEVFGDLWDGK